MPLRSWSLFRRLPRSLASQPTILNPKEWGYAVLLVAKVFIVAHTFSVYVGELSTTQGISMVPTIPMSTAKDHPWILCSNLHRRGRNIKVGDVVTYTHPIFPNQRGCKRVIGMPGDFVSVITPGRRSGDVDAIDVEEKWASVQNKVIRVPEGHCWVAGDNLEWSRDSRQYGPLPLGLIRGKVLATAMPFKSFTWLGNKKALKSPGEVDREWTIIK